MIVSSIINGGCGLGKINWSIVKTVRKLSMAKCYFCSEYNVLNILINIDMLYEKVRRYETGGVREHLLLIVNQIWTLLLATFPNFIS